MLEAAKAAVRGVIQKMLDETGPGLGLSVKCFNLPGVSGMNQTENERPYSRLRPPTWQEARADYVQGGHQRFERIFARFDAENGSLISWCWGAFLFNGLWFVYRKMYLEALVIFGLHLLLTLGSLHFIESRPRLVVNASLALIILEGFSGNWLYWRAANRKVAQAWSTFKDDPSEAGRWLKTKGGTNLWVIPLILGLTLYVLATTNFIGN